jgi:hypothetical protein
MQAGLMCRSVDRRRSKSNTTHLKLFSGTTYLAVKTSDAGPVPTSPLTSSIYQWSSLDRIWVSSRQDYRSVDPGCSSSCQSWAPSRSPHQIAKVSGQTGLNEIRLWLPLEPREPLIRAKRFVDPARNIILEGPRQPTCCRSRPVQNSET